MSDGNSYLILGATGLIGSYLYEKLKLHGETVFGTSRKTKVTSSYIKFDVMTDSIQALLALIEGNIKAVVCLGETNINACFEKYSEAYEINVEKTKQILSALAERGAHIIYFSTDNVFDGENGCYTEADNPRPVNQYGRMKLEIEQFMLKNLPESCIFRLPKVISVESRVKNLFSEMEAGYARGEISCIKGNRRSHVYINDVYDACRLAWSKGLRGLYHIADDRPYTRLELAIQFLGMMEKDVSAVHEHDLSWFHLKDGYPLDVSLCNQKFKNETDYSFSDMATIMRKYIDNKDSIAENR